MLPTDPAAMDLLVGGDLTIEGRLVDASNATLYCLIELDGTQAHCVYKPVAGERPLWDFPDGTLAGREVSAYLVAAATGHQLIPPTVLREGPLGSGMVQLWVDTLEDDDLVDVLPPDEVPGGWRRVLRAHDRFGEPAVLAHSDLDGVRLLAALDVVLNNADRKGGHVLHGTDGNVYGVDHGICLHAENKLRTVLWGWSAEPLPPDAIAMLERLDEAHRGALGAALDEHLTRREVRAIGQRIDRLLSTGVFPEPVTERPIPWPAF
jgi:uncharacterized repeat protein (TIGR03843 family)